MTDEDDLHERSTADDAFYEWLLSDHPAARAERDYRRTASYQYQRDQAAVVLVWVDKIDAQVEAPQTARTWPTRWGHVGPIALTARPYSSDPIVGRVVSAVTAPGCPWPLSLALSSGRGIARVEPRNPGPLAARPSELSSSCHTYMTRQHPKC